MHTMTKKLTGLYFLRLGFSSTHTNLSQKRGFLKMPFKLEEFKNTGFAI